MLFELKKINRSKKILYLLILSLFITIFSFYFTPGNNILLQDESFNESHLDIYGFFEGGKVPSSLYTKFQNLQQKYITGDEILSEKENLQNYLNKEKEFYKLLSDSKGEYPEIFSEKNKKRIDNLQWQIFKYESLLNNNSEDYYIHDIYKKDNIVKVFINTSNITLGLIPIIFFIIIFSDNYSREREDENLNLLYNQPVSRKRLILYKYLSIIAYILIYILCSIIFFVVLAKINNTPFSGFDSMFRVLGHSNNLAFYSGRNLIIYSLIGFFTMAMFWSSLSFLFSTKLNSQSSLASMLIILGFLFSLTANLSFMKSFFNPIYAQDIIFRLLGEFSLITKDSGETFEKLYVYNQPIKYLIYLGFSLLFLGLSLNASYEIESQSKKEKSINNMNLLRMELEKIIHSKAFLIYLLGGLLLVLTNFIFNYTLDKNVEKNNFGSGNFLYPYKAEMETININLTDINAYLSGEKSYVGYNEQTGEYVKVDKLNEKTRRYLESEKSSLESSLEELKIKEGEFNRYKDDYKNNNGKPYYDYLSKFYFEFWDRYAYQYLSYDNDLNFAESITYYNKLLKKASSNNVDPIIINGVHLSPLDSFKDKETNIKLTRNLKIYSHSAPIYIYRLIVNNNFNLLLLLLVSLMVFGAYSYDKEYGRQLEFLYTSSYKKEKIHLAKIVTEFLVALLVIFIVIGVAFLLGLVTEGISAYNFPIANYIGKKYEFIPLWLYLVKNLIALIAFVLLICSLMNALSIFIKKRNNLFAISLLVVVVANYLSKKLPASIKVFSPFTYLSTDTLADQSIRIYEAMPNSSYLMGIGVIIIWSLIFYILGIVFLSMKKDQI